MLFVNKMIDTLAGVPVDKLQIFVMLAVLGLAAFAIYAVLHLAKRR